MATMDEILSAIDAGQTAAIGLKPGDRVRFPFFH